MCIHKAFTDNIFQYTALASFVTIPSVFVHLFFMQYFTIYLKGVCMGAADVVPGVSGGTIAFITGIYERLLKAIASES